jgi:hypothetical protein
MTLSSTFSAPENDPENDPERAYELVYTAVIFYDNETVLDEVYATASARRDAVIAVLGSNHDEIEPEEIEAILGPFGGADATTALGQVISLYADYDINVHLGEVTRDVGPAFLYTSFTEYGDGTTFVEHYGSRDERLTELRLRAMHLDDGSPVEFFDNANEATCKDTIEERLTPFGGRLHLFDAQRQDVDGAYMSFATHAA